jgi:hypothetical protein
MFFFGLSGTILPYLISIIAIWSGLLLGYGQYLTKKPTVETVPIKVIEHNPMLIQSGDSSTLFLSHAWVPDKHSEEAADGTHLSDKVPVPVVQQISLFYCYISNIADVTTNCTRNKAPPVLS